jgi:hypothetical protein
MKCINNNAIINNYGSLQGLILLFKIPIYTQKTFFEIYREFGQAHSKIFAKPGLD